MRGLLQDSPEDAFLQSLDQPAPNTHREAHVRLTILTTIVDTMPKGGKNFLASTHVQWPTYLYKYVHIGLLDPKLLLFGIHRYKHRYVEIYI